MILLLDNYDSFTYNLVHQIAPLAKGVSIRVVRSARITVDEVRALQPRGVVISPGPSVPEKAGISIALFRALAPTIPILGVCLGMQALAVAFGGRVVCAAVPIHGKSSQVQHSKTGLFSGLPTPLVVGRYHSLVVQRSSVPDVLRIDAESESGEIMALSHRIYPAFGVQFHPESILTPCGSDVVRNFLDRLS